MEDKNKIKLKEKIMNFYDKINIFLEFLLAILLGIMTFKLCYLKGTYDFWSLKYLVIEAIIILPILIIIVVNVMKYRQKIEKMFLTFMIPIGMLYLILLLPSYAPDENYHIWRAYDIAQGNFITKIQEDGTTNTYIPEEIEHITKENMKHYADVVNAIKQESNYENMVRVFNPAQNYSPTLYIFSALAFLVGRICNMNMIIVIYLARILNFIIFLLGGYYSIKLIPFGKLLMTAYLFIPMVLQQAVSVTGDSLTNTTILFMISYTLFLYFKTSKITRKETILYYILAILMALAKVVYTPIIAISWLFLFRKDLTKKEKIKVVIIPTILCILIGGGFYLFQMQYKDEREYIVQTEVNGAEQIEQIIHNPVEYIKTIKNTINMKEEEYLYTLVGSNLGWLDIQVKHILITIFIFLMIVAPFLEKTKEPLNLKQKTWFIVIAIGIFLLTLTALYIGWSSVGSNLIVGVQGRYFIPSTILILLCLCMKEKNIEFKNIYVIYPIVLSLLNLDVLNTIRIFFK